MEQDDVEVLEIQARLPSSLLDALRAVAAGERPGSEIANVIWEVRKESPLRFAEMLAKEEREYREHMRALMVAEKPAEAVGLEEDVGTEKVEALIEKLLRAAS